MVAAKAGGEQAGLYRGAQRHRAGVPGWLLDGDLIVRADGGLVARRLTGRRFIADVKPEHRLPPPTRPFAATCWVTEGRHSSTAILSQSDGMLLQELPFSIELKKFVVEHYLHRHAQAVRHDIVIHDLARRASQGGARGGEPPGAPSRRGDLPVELLIDGG